MNTHPTKLRAFLSLACMVLAFATLAPATGSAQTVSTWTGGGADTNWGTGSNWSAGTAPSGDNGNNVLVFSGSTRTSPTNNLVDWTLGVGQLEFASNAASFTLGGNPFGFRPYLGSQTQQIFQNSVNTQTIGVSAFSFRNAADSQINLNAGDLVITTPSVFIDSSSSVVRSLYVTGNDTTRRTVTIAGNLNKGGTDQDPDVYVQNNKRLLVTGSINNGSGNDGSIFIDSGVLEFGSTGAMTGGSPVVGATSGSGTAAVYLNSAGSTFARQLEIRGGSSGQRIVGGLNTSGTVTYSGNFISTNSPGDYDLKAATGGATDFTGTRNFNAGLFVNRPDTATYGGTVILSGTTSSNSFTALLAGTLQISDLNQIGTGHFEFFADSGDSGTLRYTGGSATTTRTLWIDNTGITRAAIDVSQAGATLTWNPGDGNINQNLTKAGAGTLVFGGSRLTGSATVGVEAGRLVLTGSNSYSGGSSVSGGTLEVSGNGSAGGSVAGLGTGTVAIGSGGQVTWYLSTNNQHTIANAFSLSGGTLYTEDGANTFSGRVTLASGSSTIAARYEDTITLSGGLAGTGNVLFTQAGGTGGWAAPTYVLSASGSNTGTVRVTGSSGGGATKLQLGHVNALQSATLDLATGDQGSVEFTAAGTNTYNLGGLQGSRNLAIGANSLSVGGNGQSTTYSGNLSGSGFFTKTGTGTLVLSGSNTYSGGTEVIAGTLSVPGLSAIGTDYLAVKNGAAFSYTGSGTETTTRRLFLDVGAARIDVSNATGSLIWNPVAGLSTRNQAFTKTGAGSLTLGGVFSGSASVTVAGGQLSLTGSNTYTGPTTVSAGRLQVNSSDVISSGTITLGDSNTGTNNASLFIDATTADATVSRPIVIANQGSGTATLGSASTSGLHNAVFSGAVSLAKDVFLNGGTTGDRLGFTGGISGTGNVTVNGSNRVLFSGTANTYTGSTAILAGAILQLGDGGATATSFIPDSSNVNVAGTLSLAKNGNSEAVNALVGSGTVQAFFSNNTLAVGGANGSGTFAGVLQQSSGTLSLVKSGTGTQVLTGVSTYTGSTSLAGGTLGAGSAAALGSGGTISFDGGTLQYAGSNTIDYSSRFSTAANQAYSIDTNGNSVTLATALTSVGGSLAKLGSGTLTLGGANSYTGGTVISGGHLVGTTASLQGTITNNAAVTFDVATSGTYAGVMTGSGSLAKTGAGTLVLTSTTVYTGPTALDGGVIALASPDALRATTISFGGGTLQFSASNQQDFSNRFSTAPGQQYRIDTNGQDVTFMGPLTSAGGSLVKLGAGYLQLLGTNSYSGGTTLSAGEIRGTVSSIQGDVVNNGVVSFLGSSPGTYTGAMSGTGSLMMYIPGELILAGTNTYSGGTIVNGGKIRGSTSGVQGAIQNYGVVEFAQPTSGTYASVMSGTGTVTKSGAGILAVTAANTYTGLTSVVDGELKLNGSIAGGLNVAQIAALSGTGTVGGNATIIGSHAPGNSPGTQTFNANLTYEAGAVVNWELIANTTGSAGVNYDQILLPTGNLTFSGSTTLALSFNSAGSAVDWSDPFWNVNRAWVVYDLSGGSTSSLSNLALGGSLLDAQGDALSPTERGYFTTSLVGQDVMLDFVAVPEPSTWALTLAGLVGGGWAMRRRHRPSTAS